MNKHKYSYRMEFEIILGNDVVSRYFLPKIKE